MDSDNSSTKISPTFGPYSPVRKVGNLYFISGQVGIDVVTHIADVDVTEQTIKVLQNLSIVLDSVGLTLNNVVKTTIFLTDMANFTAVNNEYIKVFNEPRPARSTVGVNELPRVGGDVPILIEIEAVAAKELS
jgi:2-iminobutanoate/2-iminopropanoate deaminase